VHIGVLLYGGRGGSTTAGGDFMSLSLVSRRLQLRFNLGGGLVTVTCVNCALLLLGQEWLGSRVVSVLDSGAEGPGFKSQPRRCRVTVLGKLFALVVSLFTKLQNR